MHIRQEHPDDGPAIRAIVTAAFGRPEEADLVDALRIAGDLAISLVVEEHDRLVGYIALSRMKAPARALALAPVAVMTERQRRGIGSVLVRTAISRAKRLGYRIVFVLGEPGYYSRFGFSAETAAPFPSPYAGPYFMALDLIDAVMTPSPVVYADAFLDLE